MEVSTLKLLIENNDLFSDIEKMGGAKLFTSSLQELYEEIFKLYQATGEVNSSSFAENKYNDLFAYIIMKENKVEDKQKAFSDYIKNLKLIVLEREYHNKITKLQKADKEGNEQELKKLLFDIESILQEKKVIETLGG